MEINIHLYQDWLDAVKQIFLGSGAPLPASLSDEEIGLAYYIQTSSSEQEAEERRSANEQRIKQLQQTLLDNLESMIIPDIVSKTSYSGQQLHFRWVFAQGGEHIIEEYSEYRISLGPSQD